MWTENKNEYLANHLVNRLDVIRIAYSSELTYLHVQFVKVKQKVYAVLKQVKT